MADVSGVIVTPKGFTLRLAEVSRTGGAAFKFRPDAAARQDMAKGVGVLALLEFQADLTVRSWLDGAEIQGVWSGEALQICGVSLEDFPQSLAGNFTVRVVPMGSPNAQAEAGEVDLDPDAPDPPDALEGESIDLGGYLIEHLALAIDPFPRKPGAVFEPPADNPILSPFAALKDLKS